MKKFLSLIGFLLLLFVTVSAQNNGNGNGNNNGCGNNNGNGPGGNGNNNNNGPSLQQSQSGLPWPTTLRVLWEAAPFFQQQMNLNFGQLVARYVQGTCTITLIATNPPTTNTYRVATGGVSISVIDDAF